jgi:uncharacterized protein (UPF0297 family)
VFAKSIAAQIDYSDYVSTNAASQGNLNQVTDAPNEYQLNPLDDLENVNDFNTWLDDVYRVLRQKGLWRFIDSSIPRPPRDSLLADRWVKISRDVQIWIYQSVAKDINRIVISRNFRIEFANEYIENLKNVLNVTGYNAINKDCVT